MSVGVCVGEWGGVHGYGDVHCGYVCMQTSRGGWGCMCVHTHECAWVWMYVWVSGWVHGCGGMYMDVEVYMGVCVCVLFLQGWHQKSDLGSLVFGRVMPFG